MLVLIRLVSDKGGENLRELVAKHKGGAAIAKEILERKDELAASLGSKGRLLYMTRMAKEARRGDVSLFVHMVDPAVLGGFMLDRLSQLAGVTGMQCIGLHRPRFWPVPRDTKSYRRFAVAVQAAPRDACALYDALAALEPEGDIHWGYLCCDFSAFGSALQFSMLARDEARLATYLERKVKPLPGLKALNLMPIEQTVPLISYDDWKEYSQRHGLVPSWDEEKMLKQFAQ